MPAGRWYSEAVLVKIVVEASTFAAELLGNITEIVGLLMVGIPDERRGAPLSDWIGPEEQEPVSVTPQSQGVLTSEDRLVREFVEHWGSMARSWGINSTMGELFAFLYIKGSDWTAEALREYLGVSRGNVSMNLRELMAWGVVHRVSHSGERREFFRAETDVWTLFQRILTERKRRELEPTLNLMEKTLTTIGASGIENDPLRQRIATLQSFFHQIDSLATRLLTLEKADLDDLHRLVEEG